MIKAVIFDLGGVLFTNGTKRFVDIISHEHNIDKGKIKEVMDGEIGSLYREAKISRDKFWQIFLEKLHITADIDKLEDEWVNGYELIEGTRDLIQELSKKYKVYILSDNPKERVERVNQKHNFLEWFEDGVFSYEAGIRKPNPEIYKLVLEKAHVKAEEAVFIDDKAHFLTPAKEMGMLTFLFETPEKLKEDFVKSGLLN